MSEVTFESLKMQYQHTINCLADDNMKVRKTNITKISKDIKNKTIPSQFLKQFYLECLYNALKKSVVDSYDTVREESIQLILYILRNEGSLELNDYITAFDDITLIIFDRLGKSPFPEHLEENRYGLLELLLLLLEKISIAEEKDKYSVIESRLDKIITVLCNTQKDKNSKIVNLSSKVIMKTCEVVPLSIHSYLDKLVASIIINFKHNKNEVRCCSIDAIRVVIPLGSESLSDVMNKYVIEGMDMLSEDGKINVRINRLTTLHYWLESIQPSQLEEFESRLICSYLRSFGDDIEEVRKEALKQIYEYSQKKYKDENNDNNIDNKLPSGITLPSPFNELPSYKNTLFVRNHLNNIFKVVLDLMKESWKDQQRVNITKLLRTAIIFAQDSLSSFALNEIYTMLIQARNDEKNEVKEAAIDCSMYLGCFIKADMILDTILPLIKTSNNEESVKNLTSTIILLSAAIRGFDKNNNNNHLMNEIERICNSLQVIDITTLKYPEFQNSIVSLCSSVIDLIKNIENMNNKDLLFNIWYILLQVDSGLPPTAEESKHIIRENVTKTFEKLTTEVYKTNETKDVFNMNFDKCFKDITVDIDEWDCGTSHLLIFDRLLRRLSDNITNHNEELFAAFEKISKKGKSPEMRLNVIALLDDIIKYFSSHSYKVITILIIPNIEWEVGNIASALRKAAILCFYNLLYHNSDNIDLSNSIIELKNNITPPLISCLDDDDKDIRYITSQCLTFYFDILKGHLNEEEVNKIYGDLMKRLDDSENSIRIECCKYMIKFFDCSEKESYHGTLITYCLDCFLIHLDDPDEMIQKNVFETLKVLVVMDKNESPKSIEKAKSHSSNRFYQKNCEELIKLCN